MAVAFDAKATANSHTTGITVVTLSNANMTVGAGSNTALIAVVSWESVAAPTGISAKWDTAGTNQTMAQIGSTISNGTIRTALFGLLAPTSGNKNFTLSWTNTASCYLDLISFTGVDQTSNAVAFPHFNSATATSVGPATVNITSATGNFTVACFCADPAGDLTTLNQTNLYGPDIADSNCSGAANYASGAASNTHSCTVSASTAWSVCGVDVLASGAAVAVTLGRISPKLFRPHQGPIKGMRRAYAFPASNVITTGDGLAAGIGAATAVGAATAAAVGSAAGIGSATGVGASTAAAVGSAAGTGAATGPDVSTAASVGASAGIGAATGIGASTAAAIGSAAGTGAATAVGLGVTTADGAAAGVGATTAVGASTAAAVGSAAGTGSATGFAPSIGQATGVGAAAAVGASTAAAGASASGIGAATAVGAATAAAVGSAAGTGADTAIGAPTAAGVGSAAGVGAAAAVGASTAAAVGAASGTGTATGIGAVQGTATGDGLAQGVGAAAAVGTSIVAAVGLAIGLGTAAAAAPIDITFVDTHDGDERHQRRKKEKPLREVIAEAVKEAKAKPVISTLPISTPVVFPEPHIELVDEDEDEDEIVLMLLAG